MIRPTRWSPSMLWRRKMRLAQVVLLDIELFVALRQLADLHLRTAEEATEQA